MSTARRYSVWLMKRITAAGLTLSLCFALAIPSQAAREPRTIFDHIQNAWAFGVVRLQKPLPHRGGQLLLFPGNVAEPLYATQPNARNMMLVWELPGKTVTLEHGSTFLAPIEMLPPYAYWRDNLPLTRRHKIGGGERYIFMGDSATEVEEQLKPFLKTLSAKAPGRWTEEVEAISALLASGNAILREDAVDHMRDYNRLSRYFSDTAAEYWSTFLEGPAPSEEKAALAEAAGRFKLSRLLPALEALAGKGEEEASVAALDALEKLDAVRTPAQLQELSVNGSEATRAWAWGRRAASASGDADALAAVGAKLESDTSVMVRERILRGFGEGKVKSAAPLLSKALADAEPIGRAAAESLAKLHDIDTLESVLVAGQDPAASNAATGLGLMTNCAPCRGLLEAQATANTSELARARIVEILESLPVAAE
jgi:hypothetical protein